MRRKSWATADEQKLRGSIGTSEDYQVESYHSLYFPVSSGYSGSGATSLNQIPALLLDPAADEWVEWGFQIPKQWQSGVIKATAYVRPMDATSGTAYLSFEINLLDTSHTVTALMNKQVSVSMPGTQYEIVEVSQTSSAIVMPQAADDRENVAGLHFERQGSSGGASDTYAADLAVHGVLIEWQPETYRA